MGLPPDAASREVLEFIGGIAWNQYLVIKIEGIDEGGIVASRAQLSELLNDFWCRCLLLEVPSIVERVQKLVGFTIDKAPSDVVQLYFTQAMKCYAMGLPEASVALMRACLE